MTEAEIMQGLLTSIQVIVSLFSMFFALVSAYIAALYFFLYRAPVALRLLTFGLLSFGLVFLGGSAAIQQRMQEGLHAAWAKLPSATIAIDQVRNPIPIQIPLPSGWALYDAGVAMGWITALGVYLALAYMTFLYRWERRSRFAQGEAAIG